MRSAKQEPKCPKSVTGEHWWLHLLTGGCKCYLCGEADHR